MIGILLILIGFQAAVFASQSEEWGYLGRFGPKHWGTQFPVCGSGKMQSPIDIHPPFQAMAEPIEINYEVSPLAILNNGHTIQVNYAPGSFITIGKESYELIQFHFHQPSEEQFSAISKPMVIHFVHKNATGKLVVLGALVEAGQKNATIETLWDHLPQEAGQEVVAPNISIHASQLLPPSLQYYHYQGSLTTPPCTEGVAFYILKTPISLSPSQIVRFPHKLNARPIQPPNDRTIFETPGNT